MLYAKRHVFENDPRFPEVRVTTKILSADRRAAIEAQLADFRASVRDLYIGYADAIEMETDSEEEKQAKRLRRKGIDSQAAALTNRDIKGPYLRALVASVAGLENEDGPITDATGLLAEGPPELADAVYAFVMDRNGLTPREQGESSPPSTSVAAESGDPTVSNATSVEPSAGTTSETAPATSLTT